MTNYSADNIRDSQNFNLAAELATRGPGVISGFEVSKFFNANCVKDRGADSNSAVVQFDGKILSRTKGSFVPLEGPPGADFQEETASVLDELKKPELKPCEEPHQLNFLPKATRMPIRKLARGVVRLCSTQTLMVRKMTITIMQWS